MRCSTSNSRGLNGSTILDFGFSIWDADGSFRLLEICQESVGIFDDLYGFHAALFFNPQSKI